MASVVRAFVIYLFVFVVFRISGQRTLAQITTFDFVLLLIIGEATQQGLLADDFSVTNAFVVVGTLILTDIAVSLAQKRFPALERLVDGLPVVLIDNGQKVDLHMKRSRVSEADILERARQSQGLESLDQVKYAVLERDGSISIVPRG
jgi:uncharacterized membrane protein YcaP (DUF421 family)